MVDIAATRAEVRKTTKAEIATARAEAEKVTEEEIAVVCTVAKKAAEEDSRAGFFQGYDDLKKKVVFTHPEWDLSIFSGD